MTKEIVKIKTNEIISIYGELSTTKNLKPSRAVNDNFSKLVDIVDNTPTDISEKILGEERINVLRSKIRELSSTGEYELETFWSENILQSNDTRTSISKFPYIKNYEVLVSNEVQALTSCGIHTHHRILFVGSGPLPLSSMIMVEKYGFLVDNVDVDISACEVSRKIVEKLGLSSTVQIINKDILEIKDFSSYDAVFVAALVGKDGEEKTKIVDHIAQHARKGTHVILRSVTDLGVLLYPEVKFEHLKSMEAVKIYDKQPGVINNLIIGRTK